jgi:hypothetical protein
MHRVAFKRAGHERAGKAPAETHTLRAIEIAAACLALRPQPLQLALVCFAKLVLREPAEVVDAPENDRRAHLEAPGKARKRIA